MAISGWLVLAVACLTYVALGLWAISQIFPSPSRRSPLRPRPTIRRRPTTGRPRPMNTTRQGHDHGGKNHLLGMLGIGALVLAVLVLSGKSFGEALPLAAFLACPLMMVGMMFMMRGGNGHQQGTHVTDDRDHDATAQWQDSASTTSAQRDNTPQP
jgi:hypothetical protein